MKSKHASGASGMEAGGHNASPLRPGSGKLITSNKQATAVAASEALKTGKAIPRKKKARNRALR